MFNFKGIKKAVQGAKQGVLVVADKGSDVVGGFSEDPDFSASGVKSKLKDARDQLKGGKQFVSESGDDIIDKVGEDRIEDTKELAKDVAHNVKHYGAFGENFLGYSDPTKDLRKAVKAKEKAAKKAKKAQKKKGGKAEDLFDPENLAKYKAELEEKRRLAAEISPALTDVEKSAEPSRQPSPKKEQGSPNFESVRRDSADSWGVPQKPDSPDFEFESPPKGLSPDEKKANVGDDWKSQLESLTGGIDHLLKEKKDKLEQIKEVSYYQRKKTGDEIAEDARVARPQTLVGKRKKKWVDLDNDEIEEHEGEIPIVLSDGDNVTSDEEEEEKVDTKEASPVQDFWQEIKEEPEKEEEIEEDKQEEDEDDLFNTTFVNETLASLDVKLAEIPATPEEEEDDIFDTKYADEVVKKAQRERAAFEKAESNKLKFGCIASAADVLAGKVTSVDKTNIQQTAKKRNRRDYRRNLIADEVSDVAVVGDIPQAVVIQKEELKDAETVELDASVADPLSTEILSSTDPSEVKASKDCQEQQLSEDLKEFDIVQNDAGILTSNSAPIATEPEEEEEEDPFDAAFDDLAKEAIHKADDKDRLAKLEEDLFNDDLFDTTAADDVLNLASLTNVVDKKELEEQVVLDDFEDKDPFDTSAYEHLTKDLEEELEFESLAKREIDENVIGTAVAVDLGPDPFEVVEKQAADQKFDEGGWGAFDQKVERKKPPRPPPRRPPPPRPAPPPSTPQVKVDYASGRNTPSVIVKAPSSESIKSWNVTQADTLILKCNIEAIEAHALLEEDNQEEEDPFDTKQFEGIVAELKAKEEDPFDTTTVVTDPGPNELKLIEKEVLGTDDVEDPFDTTAVEDLVPNVEDDDFDPFDTTVADKVLPVRTPRVSQKSVVSIEDDDFDPEASFKTRKPPPPPRPAVPEKVLDPFFTEQEKKPPPPAPVVQPKKPVYNPYARTRPLTLQEKQAIEEAKRLQEIEAELLARGPVDDDDDFDFDPRAKTPPPVEEKPETPESPDPFNTDGIDPFDTSALQITG